MEHGFLTEGNGENEEGKPRKTRSRGSASQHEKDLTAKSAESTEFQRPEGRRRKRNQQQQEK
jgi:hypothetical protein